MRPQRINGMNAAFLGMISANGGFTVAWGGRSKGVDMKSGAVGVLCLMSVLWSQEGQAHESVRITKMRARAAVQLSSFDQKVCHGADGDYTLVRLTGEGPITSTDSRITGTFYVDAMILHNPQGQGISRDKFKIRDPRSRRIKVQGTAWAVDADPNPIHGMAMAKLADGSRLLAESVVYLPAPGSPDPIIIEYGSDQGSTDPADRAYIVSGNCRELRDEFDAFDVD